MFKKFLHELPGYGLPNGPGSDADLSPVAQADLAPLPEPTRRYFQFMGAIGRPRDWSFRIGFMGRIKISRQGGWLRCTGWQYDTRLSVARVCYLKAAVCGAFPILGRDTYVNGRGRMLIRLFDRFTVEDGKGEGFDIGELVTYLAECVFFAPSMLLAPEVRFAAEDADSFGVSIQDRGRTVSGRVLVDGRGAPVNFETTDRFYYEKGMAKAERCRWTTPIRTYGEAGGRRMAANVKAVWRPEGVDEFEYADFTFDPATAEFNVAPGQGAVTA